MSETITLQYRTDVTVEQILAAATTPSAPSTRRRITHSEFNTAKVLTGAGDVPVTKVAGFVPALSAGAATIDLTAVKGANQADVDGSGLRVVAAKFRNKAGQAAITISKGASDGYDGFGADFSVTLTAGADVTLFAAGDAGENGAVVGAANKTLDLAGTGTDELEVILVFGAGGS